MKLNKTGAINKRLDETLENLRIRFMSFLFPETYLFKLTIINHCCLVNEKMLRPDSCLIGIISFRITC